MEAQPTETEPSGAAGERQRPHIARRITMNYSPFEDPPEYHESVATGQAKGDCRAPTCSALSDLVENLAAWGEHFREERHGATLTLLRAKKTLTDMTSLLNEAYVFIGMPHKNLHPWRQALDDWKERVEAETGWRHFDEVQKFEQNAKG